MQIKGRVLVVAGSDSSGCTGIQADLKTILALGGYAMSAVTAVTARDTHGVVDIHPIPPAFVQRQMRLALQDIGADVIHLGMLHNADLINAVSDVIEELAPDTPIVLDPVAVTKTGRSLLDKEGMRHLKIRLLPRTTIITPNLREGELLAGMTIHTDEERHHAAQMMLTLGARAVLLKGGHDDQDPVVDLLATDEGAVTQYSAPRIESRHMAGIGSTLSAGIACGLAQGLSLHKSVERARAYLQAAIKEAPGYGHGTGPINHGITVSTLPGF